MGMTLNNLCDSCTNIGCEFQSGIVRTKCAFYMPPHIEPDNCGNYVVMQRTDGLYAKSLEELDKCDYIDKSKKLYTKADIVAMLEELKKEIEETVKKEKLIDKKWANGLHYSEKIIQQKIEKLKENEDGKDN